MLFPGTDDDNDDDDGDGDTTDESDSDAGREPVRIPTSVPRSYTRNR